MSETEQAQHNDAMNQFIELANQLKQGGLPVPTWCRGE